MDIQVWDPYREMRQMERVMNRALRGFGAWPAEAEKWNIPIDVVQKNDEIVVHASLPGVSPEKIEVTVEDDVLTVKAESEIKSETQESGYLIRERAFGMFYRALRLPESVATEKITSQYENGVLTINLPKAEEKKKKLIKIGVKGGPQAIEGPEAKRK
jgi:HSP20 family protein